MAKKDYSNLTKDQLLEVIYKLEGMKKYGLVWDEERVPEKVVTDCQDKLPVLTEVKGKEITTDENESTHILIEGDNYHALSVLNYTHKGKIDLIYIDPPYNTGAKDWKYNNDYVDKQDTFRHSKWLTMINHRLQLARELLKDDGIIVCAIDHNELFTLGVLMDEIFSEENRLGIVSVVHKPEGRNQEKFFGTSNEFALFYSKNKSLSKFNKIAIDEETAEKFTENDDKGNYKLKNFIRMADGKYATKEAKPKFYYPIYVSDDLKTISLENGKGFTAIYPIIKSGVERTWKTLPNTFLDYLNEGNIIAKKENEEIVIYEKLYEDQVIRTHWIKKEYHAYHFGTKILDSILGEKRFNFPKSLHLIEDILKLITQKNNSIILDFFAGSGTTGHAVLNLNKKDGGNRKFILCTNNENEICEEVTYPRVKNVITGYKNDKKESVEGLGNNLKYFKTSYVANNRNKDQLKIDITKRCTEMLCLKEGIFNLYKEEADYKIFQQGNRYLAVYYDFANVSLDELKEEMNALKGEKVLYCFTVDNHGLDKDNFRGWKNIRLEPIPQKILDVYKRIFKN
jgi:adenine-specific DNA-methyltransferase